MDGRFCVNHDWDYRLSGDNWIVDVTVHDQPAPTNTPNAIFVTDVSARRIAFTMTVLCDDAGKVDAATSQLARQRADRWFKMLNEHTGDMLL
jgi:hypothetical protein